MQICSGLRTNLLALNQILPARRCRGIFCKGKNRCINKWPIAILLCLVALLLITQQRNTSITFAKLEAIKLWEILNTLALQPYQASTPKPKINESISLALLKNGSIRCRDVQSLFPDMIPPVIHWTNRDQTVLQRHHDMLRSWHNVLGNNVAYMYWEDKDVDNLLAKHYTSLIPAYRKLRNGLMRSDIARLIILHHVGGVYSDLDVTLLRDIRGLLRQHSALWSQEPIEHIYYLYNRMQLLSNALFMTRARHEFLNYVIRSWPSWFQSKWSHQVKSLSDPSNAVLITGPMMLNHFLDKCSADNSSRLNCSTVELAHPDSFQPLYDGWLQNIARRKCQVQRKTMTAAQMKHCDSMASRKFQQRPVDLNVTYAVHRFLHTSYGRRNSYANAKPAKHILSLSTCVI